MTVLGMNRRNALIQRCNPRAAIRGVNQKFQTKNRLAAVGVPVPRTLALIESAGELAGFDFSALPDAFAVKPNRGRCGEGVVLVDGRTADGWRQLNGQTLTLRMLQHHIGRILEGEMSLEGSDSDAAIIEPLIRSHPDMARLVPFGLPDIRIICLGDVPLMAMTRLPTTESGGRANLHQGAVGAAISLSSGRIFRAVAASTAIELHPSTGAPLIGQPIPYWQDALHAARRCSAALNLGYVGVDIVIDADEGVQVLECNAFPGLEIQNVNGSGLAERLDVIERRRGMPASPRPWPVAGRVAEVAKQIADAVIRVGTAGPIAFGPTPALVAV